MVEPSGVEPITSAAEAAQSRLILEDIEAALAKVETPEARDVLLDLRAMHRAALDGWSVSERVDPSPG